MKKRAGRAENGEGSVFYSTAYGRYVGSVVLPGGKKKRVYGDKGDRSKTARLGVKERIAAYCTRRGTRDGFVQLKAFADEWIENAPIRTNTRTLYRWLSKAQFGALGSMNLIDLAPKHINAHFNELDSGPTTKRRFYSLLHRVLREAVQLEMIASNPASNVTAPRVPHREQLVLSPQETGYLLQAARGDRLEALIIVALESSMGPAELFALRRRDVFLDEACLKVTGDLVMTPGGEAVVEATKTAKRRRTVPLSPFAVDALRERMKLCLQEGGGTEFIFTSPDGQPIRNTNLRRRWWKPLIDKAADLAEADARAAGDPDYRFPRELTMYGLRLTSIDLLGFLGVPITVASGRMGHASIKLTVDTYGHLYEPMGRDVATKFEHLWQGLANPRPGAKVHALVHDLVHGADDAGEATKKKARR